MPTTISIDSITTEDVAPTVAPHRISALGGWNTVTVKFTPTHDGQLVPTEDLLPSDGTLFPNEGVYPDDGNYPDIGALIPGVPRDIIGWEIRVGGSDKASGKLVAKAGSRASATRPASSRAVTNPAVSTYGVRSPSGSQITVSFAYADANDLTGDGAKNVNVYVLTESQGWS